MGRGRLTVLVLIGCLLLSLLSLTFTATLEPFQLGDDSDSVTGLPEFKEPPTSANIVGRSENIVGSAWSMAVNAYGDSFDYGGSGIAVDSSGNSFLIGYFEGTATFGSTSLTSSGERDIYVAKLSSSGSWLWAVKAGGSLSDEGLGIAVDSSGSAYATGHFEGTATFGPTSLTSSGERDIYIAKLSSSGSWQWAVRAGGSLSDEGLGIAVDSSGSAYATGHYEGTATFGSTSLNSSGESDIFVAKLSSSGLWQWAVRAGGSLSDEGHGIAVDLSGDVSVTGYFEGTATFDSHMEYTSGDSNLFVAKLNSSGLWQWTASAGYNGADEGHGIAVDSIGSIYVTGFYSKWLSTNDEAGSSNINYHSTGERDVFIGKVSSSGLWLWAVGAGGSYLDEGHGIAVDSSGSSYVTGSFYDSLWSEKNQKLYTGLAGNEAVQISSSGGADIFVLKLSSSGQFEDYQQLHSAGGLYMDKGYGIAVDSTGNTHVTGYFEGEATFGNISLNSSGQRDIFVAQISSDGDNDGVADISDLCPNTPSYVAYQVDSDGCVWEEKDDDGDTILNYEDRCPATPANETADTESPWKGCSPNQKDTDEDGVADSSDQCPDTSYNNDVNEVGCASHERDSDGDGFNDAFDMCPGHDDSVDVDGDGTPDGCDSLIDSDGDGVADSSDQCPNYDDRDDADGDGIPNGCDTTPEGLLEESHVDSGGSVVGIPSMICLVIIGLLLVIGIIKHYGSRGNPKPPRARIPSPSPILPLPSPVQGMELRDATVSDSAQQQNLQSTVNQLELQRKQAEYEADQLRKQLSDSASFTALQNQEMQAEMTRLQQTVEQIEQEKSTMQSELEKVKESTTVVQNITYNVQDSVISGDISSTGLNEKDE
jgi:hypothetical protein